MKKLVLTLRWGISIAFLIAMIVLPDIVFSAEGGATFAMANFITSSITWGGKETLEYFVRPQFIGKAPWETQGVRTITNVQSDMKLNYIGTANKILKAYVKGFSAATGTTYTQRTLSVVRMKAEASEDSNDFYQTVYEQIQRKGHEEWDDVSGTVVMDMVVEVWTKAVKSDIFRQFWLNDENKETLNTAGNYSGTADVDYNAFKGMWTRLMEDSATSPSDTQIYRYTILDGAVAQVDTFTLTTGSSGNLVMTINGVNYTVAYGTSLTVTAALFVTTHAAALALRDITVTSSGDDLVFTSAVPGQPFDAPATASASSITGTNVATTANTAPTALAAGESVTILQDLYTNCDRVLKEIPMNEKIFLVSDDVYENYQTYNESLGTEKSHNQLIDGYTGISYRGVPVIPMGWGVHLDADFAHASGELYAYPHRCIYTENNNLVLGMDVLNEYTQMMTWFNKDEQENRFRQQLKIGTQYVHNKLTAVAY